MFDFDVDFHVWFFMFDFNAKSNGIEEKFVQIY